MSQQGNQQPQSATGSGSNVLVAVRVRPLHSAEISGGAKSCIQVFDQRVVAIKKNGDAGQYLKSQQLCINEYEYDVVFDEKATQQEIYEKTAKSYIPKLIGGQNVTVFAYGATGAGKTHTMLGDTRIEEVNLSSKSSIAGHNGIIPNAVKDVFRLISAKISRNLSNQSKALANEQYAVFVTFLEVYNEQVYDLLEPSGKVLAVREDQEKGIVIVAGVTEQPVGTYPEVIDLIIQGNKQRKTESTMANALSSRSHAVLQLLIKKTTKLDNGKEVLTESKLSLIDLAGSERASATNNRGLRLQEGAKINQSLLALANCINALAENTAISNNNVSSSSSSVPSNISSANSAKPLKNVKFRDSKLTHLLKSSLEGNCHLIMIANINPSDQTYEDSHNTLKYANRAKNIKVNPMVQQKETKEVNWIERESQLRQENSALKQIIQKLQIQVESLQAFQKYVLTYKRIPGSEEAVGHDQQKEMKENLILNRSIESHSVSVKTSLPIYQDYNLHDISSEIQESVNEVLSYSTLPMLESINPQRSSDTFLFDTSLSSLSTAQDLISDYLSTSQEGGRSSTSSALEERRLSENNEDRRHSASYSPEKIVTKKVEKEEELIEEFEFDIVNDVNQMIKMFENNDEPTTVLEKRAASENQVKVEQQEQGDDEKEEEIMIVNNLTQKRRKINETRRKSIAITRRKSFIPTFTSNKPVDNEEEEENHIMEVDDTPVPLPSTALPVESAPMVTKATESDDVMLTMDILPKASEEPVLSNNNTKKRRASNLPTASLSVQTRSMRRQSISGATITPAATPSTESVKQKKVEPVTTAVTINHTANDENNVPPTNKRSAISKRETPTNTPSTSTITTRRGVLTDSNIAKTSSSLNITKSTSVTGEKSSISKVSVNKDININADKENQENQANKEFSSVNIEKPKPLEFDDFQIDWLGTSVAVSTAMPPPPSPTRRETRRMKMANRQSSLAKVTAMLDSVAQNVNNLATSFAVPPPVNDTDMAEEIPMPLPTVGTRRKTISMR
eukprot:gene2359-2506_t